MSVFKDNRQIISIQLPSYPEDTVEMYTQLLAGESIEMDKIANNIEQGMFMIHKLIKSWTFTDESGKLWDISINNIQKLPSEDIVYILNTISNLKKDAESKK